MDVQKQLWRHLKFPEIKLWLSRNNCGAPNMLKGILKSTMAVPKHCEAPQIFIGVIKSIVAVPKSCGVPYLFQGNFKSNYGYTEPIENLYKY